MSILRCFNFARPLSPAGVTGAPRPLTMAVPMEGAEGSAFEQAMRTMRDDNQLLRQHVQDLQRRLETIESTHTAPDVPERHSAARDEYNIERMAHGFWDGQFRARHGWRVLGYYGSQQDAEVQCCIDSAMQSGRISAES